MAYVFRVNRITIVRLNESGFDDRDAAQCFQARRLDCSMILNDGGYQFLTDFMMVLHL